MAQQEFKFLDLLEAKRDGKQLSEEQIAFFVANLESIPEYQISAFLMAVYFQDMTTEETASLTRLMRDSGDKLSFPVDAARPLVDKHSTGGVGDKISLPLAPLLACLGCRVPMISGRGLGITGGTLDKLETIPGFQTGLPVEEISQIVESCGAVICGQTAKMVPADKKLYALRDVTGTVPSIALITASIMSKKLAEDISALVLDVKFGSAAFMKTRKDARKLAQSMVDLGTATGVATSALLTNMDTPLGRAAGNWLEVKESVEVLENKGPADVTELVLECASQLLVLAGKVETQKEGLERATEMLKSGAPRQKWDEMVKAQHGDVDAMNKKLALDTTAAAVVEILADADGVVTAVDALQVGEVVRDIGGGRVTKESVVLGDVGVDRLVKPGESVSKGGVLVRVHAADEATATRAGARVKAAITVGTKVKAVPLVAEVVSARAAGKKRGRS